MALKEEQKASNEQSYEIPTRKVGTLNIVPLINGLWQVGNGSLHKNVSLQRLTDAMVRYSSIGLTAWDGADIYGPAECIMGLHKERMSATKQPKNVYMTKYVPRPNLKEYPLKMVESAVDDALKKMKTDSLDFLQFHWWQYEDIRYLNVCRHFVHLQKKGKIKNIALCNFNTANMANIIDNVEGIAIASNQVPYSIIDRRAENEMTVFCMKHDVKLITYGTLLGGFLSERWFGREEPSKDELDTASLQKYKKWISAWSNNNWNLFQKLLKTLKDIGEKHNGSSISQIAVRYILDKPVVGGVIIGCRLTVSNHREETVKIFGIELSDTDRQKIEKVVQMGRALRGDPADEYRGTKL